MKNWLFSDDYEFTDLFQSSPGNIGAKSGEPCPYGYYCQEGTDEVGICEDGKFITKTIINGNPGASDPLTECQPCLNGKLCPASAKKSKPCNRGGYCLGGLSYPCPIGTYNNKTAAESISACDPCEAGFVCPEEKMTKNDWYPAQAGFYIPSQELNAASDQTPCKPGYYLAVQESTSEKSCQPCPLGYYCPDKNMTSPYGCNEGTYCPEMQTDNTLCEEGYYCELTKTKTPCPAGYYCSEGSAFPTICPDGTYCPFSGQCGFDQYTGEGLGIGSNNTSPCRCPNGYFEKDDSERRSQNDTCQSCPPGTYNRYGITRTDRCETCRPGVLCLNNALTDNATDLHNNGQTLPCPAGFYCSEGALEPVPCPAGTFYISVDGNPDRDDVCRPCPIDFFGEFKGQFECYSCGDFAEQNTPGSTSCECKGRHRKFHPSDQTCPCEVGYVKSESADENTGDCTKKIYEICSQNTYRSQRGECLTADEFEKECQEPGYFLS